MSWQNLSEQLWAKGVDYAAQAVGALAIVIVAWIIAGWSGRALTRNLGRVRVDETLSRFLGKLLRWAVLVLAGLAALSLLGVQTTSFTAVLAATGFAVGLAFKDTLSNFSAGVMLLLFRPYKVGDVIVASGHTGKVYEIDLFSTYLDTFDNRRMVLPNGAVFNAPIENISHHATRRVDIAVGSDYAADMDHTREVLAAAVAGVPGVLADPAPAIVVTDLGASSVNWAVRVWANSADFLSVQQATFLAVKRALDESGISIPFPQMDVHLNQGAASVA